MRSLADPAKAAVLLLLSLWATALLSCKSQDAVIRDAAAPTEAVDAVAGAPLWIWHPTPGTSWQIQFSGAIDTSLDVQVFDLDLQTLSKATVDELHSRGARVICYFSGGTFESWRPDAQDFPKDIIGVPLADWPGEHWLDVRQLDVLRPIMLKRLQLAVQKGCDAVDTDNMDVYMQESGFAISYAQQLKYNIMLAEEAHRRGLAIGLKNDLGQVGELVDSYDFAINESCINFGECQRLEPFIARNKAVFGIEYSGRASSVCAQANRLNHDTLIKRHLLDAHRVPCR